MDREDVIQFLCGLDQDELLDVIREVEDRYEVPEEHNGIVDVLLMNPRGKRTAVAKVLRSLDCMDFDGPKQALGYVDRAPFVVCENVFEDEGNRIKDALEDAGARVELRYHTGQEEFRILGGPVA